MISQVRRFCLRACFRRNRRTLRRRAKHFRGDEELRPPAGVLVIARLGTAPGPLRLETNGSLSETYAHHWLEKEIDARLTP